MSEQTVPPVATDAEVALLGAAIQWPESAAQITDLITDPCMFYSAAHQQIFEAIQTLISTGRIVDPVSLTAQLQQSGSLQNIGGQNKILELAAEAAVSPATISRYIEIVRERGTSRQLLGVAAEIQEIALTGDGTAAVTKAEQLLSEVTATGTANAQGGSELADNWNALRRSEPAVALSTGFTSLDKALGGGLQPGRLYLVGARPSMGKSAFAQAIIHHVAIELGRPAVLASLEMGWEETLGRLAAADLHIDHTRVDPYRTHPEDETSLDQFAARVAQAPLMIDDSSGQSVPKIRALAREAENRYGPLGVLVIDYLQLMELSTSIGRESREQQVAAASRALKVLARQLNVPVIVLSQLNRGVESRVDKRPSLADLRESGALEQDADVVLFLYRDEYYDPDTVDRGITEVIIAKQRAGRAGRGGGSTVRLSWIASQTRFADLDETEPSGPVMCEF